MSDGEHRPSSYGEWDRALQEGSFEEVFATLEQVVVHLEDGRLSLADSVACYELGVLLAERCDQFLAEAELRVSRLEETADRLDEAMGREDDANGR